MVTSLPPLPERCETVFPASSAQQRMWFLHQLAPTSPRYNVSMVFQVRGTLQVLLLERCLVELVHRHEALRTSFAIHEDGIVQLVQAFQQPQIAVVDLRPFDGETRSARAKQLIEQAELRPFDLSRLPLFRFQLLRVDEQEWLLQSVFHHIATDGQSQESFYRELSLLYNAFAQGQASPLPPLPFQYTDYTHWQREVLTGPARAKHLACWQQQLADAPALLELPADAPRPERPSYQGAASRFCLPAALTEQLRVFARETRATPFMILLAAFQTLLFRASGQDDIVTGSPASGRARPEFEQMQGLFINTLALRSSFDGNLSFRQLVAQIRHTCLDAYAHQEIPFDQVVEALHIERTLRYQPLCQTMFTYQLGGSSPLQLLDCDVQLRDTSQVSGGFDLVLDLRDTPEGLHGTWSYSSELFAPERIRRHSGHFQRILEQAFASPDQPVISYEVLTSPEREQIFAWNATAAAYPQHACIHHLVEGQARLRPEAVAVLSAQGRETTYMELNRQANQLAHYLRATGVGQGTFVGICMERSLEMIVAQLAVLKVGAVYVPLAPDYPADRLSFLLNDTGMRVVLTLQRFQACLPQAEHTLEVIALDLEEGAFADFLGGNLTDGPVETTTPDAPAYVLYTSGSTGQPKGVCISHRAVVVRLASEGNVVSWHPGDRVAHVSHPCFDASTFEVWGGLMNGSTVVILEKADLLSPPRLARLLREKAISFLFLTTALFNQFALTMPEMFAPLHTLAFGGEAVNPDAARAILEHPDRPKALINAYGPTEAAMYVTCFSLDEWKERQGAVPIGRAIANTEIFLLDEQGLMVPVGVPAEIHAGGPGLALGYLGRPDLTADRFVPHPFRPGERLYRTGDLGVYQEDGLLHFVGRTDRQVKLHGYRIELGEIEAVLREHPHVRETLVRVHEGLSGDRSLVAYLLSPDGWAAQEQRASDVRAFLASRLPGYMIPSAFVCLDAWPLSPNGKINYRALPSPSVEERQNAGQQEHVQARTDLERYLVNLWQDIFSRADLSITDHFFDLGGHSLLAAQLVARLSAHLGREVSVVALFEHPTIEQLAAFAQSLLDEGADAPDYLPLVAAHPPQERGEISLQPRHASAYTVRETRSLLSRLLSGSLPPVDAVTLGYLSPNSFGQMRREDVISDLFEGLPVVASLLETPWGRMASMPLPLFEDQLFEQEQLLPHCREALRLAKQIGARIVSLGGLLPVATDLGEALVSENDEASPHISTGHAAIASAIVLSLRRLLEQSGRRFEQARVGLLGLGSIGRAVLPVMLSAFPHPHTISLCDLYASPEALEEVTHALRLWGFEGEIAALRAEGGCLPAAFYTSTVLVSMTNVPDVIEIERLAPGTLLVDDSIPGSFRVEDARIRLEKQGDLLFTQGRMLRVQEPLTETIYLPPRWARAMSGGEQVWQSMQERDPHLIPACALSSLLASRFALVPTVGQTRAEVALQYAAQMAGLGIEAAPLACEGYLLPPQQLADFHARFAEM